MTKCQNSTMIRPQREYTRAKYSMKAHFIKNTLLPWIMWACGAFFYCYVYFLRISPSMMTDELSAHFMIQATLIGNLAAFFYYAYIPMQLPVGIISDRYGVRTLLSGACLICSVGVILFTSASSLNIAYLGRFIIGFGSAFGFISTLKIATEWLPPNRFAIAAGSTTALGMIAAYFADNVLVDLISTFGYQHVLYSSAFIGIGLSVLIFLVVRDKPAYNNNEALTYTRLFIGLKTIVKSRQMWLISIIGLLAYLPASMYLDLWGIKHISQLYHVSQKISAHIVSMTFLGWIVSSPLLGALSDTIKRRKLPLLLCLICAFFIVLIIFYSPHLPIVLLYFLFFALGLCCGVHPLCFALSRENNPNHLSATALAATNTIIMVGGLSQPFVGWLLDLHSHHTVVNNLYSSADYQFAMAVLPIGLGLSGFLCFFLKETHCSLHEEPTNLMNYDAPHTD
jgi:MFS family permease